MNKTLRVYAAVCSGMMATSAWATQIDGVQFKFEDNQSVIEIDGKDLGGYQKSEKKNPPQLILTFDDATLAADAVKKLDTSSFKSNVLQVSTYPLAAEGGKPAQARVVIDFKKSSEYTFNDSDGKLEVKIADAASTAEVTSTPSPLVDEKPAATPEPLSQAVTAEQDKKFTGSPISLNLRDADVHDVLRMISDTSGFNIVIHPSVTGKITVALDHVPWDQALEVVLTTLKLGAERNGSVLRVLPREMLLSEKQQELDTKKLASQSAPRITRVFPISYSDLAQLSTLLTSFANAQNTAPGNSGIPTTIMVDATTQSLIVRDTAEGLDRIRKMIQFLDVQTPQVMIEGKVVEATEGFSNSFGGSSGIGGARYGFSGNGVSNLIGAPVVGAGTGSIGAAGSGVFGAADIFSISGRVISVNASLSIAESENKIKVVSSPKTVVLSGKTASITQNTSVGVLLITPATANSPSTQSIQSIQANTRLNVTPRVTNDGSVLMKLDLSRDIISQANPQAPVTEPRTMNTEVIVDSGSTLVIGGVLNLDESRTESGIPILRKIPLIGWLFGSESTQKTKTELMFFVTPRVLNQKKTALANPDSLAPKL